MSSTKGITTSYQAISASLFGGYPLRLNRRFILTPLLGVGIIHHLIEDSFYEEVTGYSDGLITAALGLDMILTDSLSINLQPEFSLFLEEEEQGFFANISCEIVYQL